MGSVARPRSFQFNGHLLEPGSARDKEENPTQSSLWELMINGGDGLAVNN